MDQEKNKEEIIKKREEAIRQILKLLNDNDLTLKVEHNITIVPKN